MIADTSAHRAQMPDVPIQPVLACRQGQSAGAHRTLVHTANASARHDGTSFHWRVPIAFDSQRTSLPRHSVLLTWDRIVNVLRVAAHYAHAVAAAMRRAAPLQARAVLTQDNASQSR